MDKKKYMGYAAAFSTLESLKTELTLNQKLTLHSPRVGAATEGSKLEISRSMLMEAGHWRSGAVDTYIQVESPKE